MTTPLSPPEHDNLERDREPHLGLRLRLWFACLAGAALAGVGSLWVLGTRVQPGATDPADLLAWLAGVAFAAVLAGLLLALWLDHHIVSHLRGLLRGIRSGRVAELRGLPGGDGWGELSELTDAAQSLLTQQRRTVRAHEELEQERAQLTALAAAVEGWLQRETWSTPTIERGPVAELADAIGRGIGRRALVEEQNREAARQVATELVESIADAQESAEQAERGFVEATALLTTVRELQRLSTELQNALAAASAVTVGAPPPVAGAREAIEGLVSASRESVEAIGRGMLRVNDVAEQVRQLANRSTLIAIHVVTGARREGGAGDEAAEELKQLARDVRETTDRTTMFAQDIDAAVADASDRMRLAREQALQRLQASAEPVTAPAVAQARALDDAHRLLERVREMVQDAARKGERLSAAGERASRAAERLARRMDDEASEAGALVVRLTPVGDLVPPLPVPARLELLGDPRDAALEPERAEPKAEEQT